VELQEVARRVLLGHWKVIVALIIASALVVTAIHLREAPTYTAATRLVIDAPAPTSGTEATAIADAAKAIVTSPTHIIAALTSAGLVRDPVEVGRNITLTPLGTSGVLQLKVQDSNPVSAASLANALADDLIKTRLAFSPAARVSALDDRIKAANDQISVLDQQIASLDEQLQTLQKQVNASNIQTATVRAQILADRIAAYSNERAALTQGELQFESERAGLATSSSTPTPSVIDRALPPANPDPSRLPVDLALALVVGVVLGVAAASILETFGPTLASGESVAKALGVPVLGWLPDLAGTLPDRLILAASAADVGAVELLGVGDTPNLSALAKSLRGPDQAEGKGLPIFSADEAPDRYRHGKASPSSGFVLVAPDGIRKAALTPVKDLVSFSGRPLIGVIAHMPNRPARSSQGSVKATPRLAVVPKDGGDPLKGMSKEVAHDLWGAR
jgi:capsular polysaccharide biosynthesis protein